MSAADVIETAARALYYRDHAEEGLTPAQEWENVSSGVRAVYRVTVSQDGDEA
jgi:hypothetical protein